MVMILQKLLVLTLWYSNIFFYLFIVASLLFFITIFVTMRVIRKKNSDTKLIQQQFAAKIDIIRRDHSDTLERIRVEMLKREEERTRQWIESEKETLHVLNGISTLLDLNDKIGRVESEKILNALEKFHDEMVKIISSST